MWQHVTVLMLQRNMRLSNPALPAVEVTDLDAFAHFVLSVGDGTVPMVVREGEATPSLVSLPSDITLLPESDCQSAIVDAVYDSFLDKHSDPTYLVQRALVCPTNKVADSIKDVIISMVPGDETVFESCDTICKTMGNMADADLLYSPEFLHNIDPAIFHGIELRQKIVCQ